MVAGVVLVVGSGGGGWIGTEIFSFESGMAARDKGWIPVPLKPPIRCSGRSTLSHIFAIRDGKVCRSTLAASVSNLYAFKTCFHAVLKGPNTPTSRGWRRWVVCGGNTYKMTSLARAISMRVRESWEVCPSKNNTTGPFPLMSAVAGKKNLGKPFPEVNCLHPT